MILETASVVTVNHLGGFDILSVNLRTGSGEPARAIVWQAKADVLVDADGRLLGISINHALPEGVRVGT